MVAPGAVNSLTIDAIVLAADGIRYTPAGVPVLELSLRHQSAQLEAGHPREVSCELHAKALGEVAKALEGVVPGTALRLTGFVARRWRSGTSLALHITDYRLTKGH